ncbi:MAG: nucleotide exchange factor GrpE [Candidatus Melainabacteria bacterium]|nr:nucleotide exchange factor GrpE [Candidatus Melainabacteria bacterium]
MTEDRGELNNEQGQAPQTVSGNEDDKGTRMDAAKAFFRALHAGTEEVAPDLELTGVPEREKASSSVQVCANCQHLESQLAQTQQRLHESENLYKRVLADFDNFRRRIDREREEFLNVGIQKAVESLLPALDDMDRAQASLTSEMSAEKLLESLRLVFTRVSRCLEQLGVQPLSVLGQHFDPKFHEPVQEVATTEFPDGSVVHELRRGYTLNDKVIRPALVNVASNASVDEADSSGSLSSDTGEPRCESSQEPKVYDLSEFEDVNLDDERSEINSNECLETPAGGSRAALDE